MNKKQFSLVLVVTLISGLVGATLSGWFFLGQVNASTVPGQIIARDIILVDKENRVRAGMKMSAGGPLIYLADDKGNPRAALYGDQTGPFLQFFDDNGITRITLGFDDTEVPGLFLLDAEKKIRGSMALRKESPRLSLTHPSGANAFVVELNNKGEAGLILYGDDSQQASGLSAGKRRGSLFVSGEDGRPRAGIFYQGDQGSSLSLNDSNGVSRLLANVSPTRGPQLTMWNKDKTQVLTNQVDPKGGPQVAMMKGKAAYVAGVMGSIPYFTLRHPGGSAMEAVFTHLGQPYLFVNDHGKKLWSVPAATPPGVQEIKIHSLTK